MLRYLYPQDGYGDIIAHSYIKDFVIKNVTYRLTKKLLVFNCISKYNEMNFGLFWPTKCHKIVNITRYECDFTITPIVHTEDLRKFQWAVPKCSFWNNWVVKQVSPSNCMLKNSVGSVRHGTR